MPRTAASNCGIDEMRAAVLPACSRAIAAGLLCLMAGGGVQAQLFADDDARKAILDLRTRLAQSEEQARARYPAVLVYHTRFRPLKHTLSGNPEKTFMKLVVDGESDRVLGVHMVGPEAGEIIQGMAVALQAGATKRVFDATIGIHPTSAEEFVTLREPVR